MQISSPETANSPTPRMRNTARELSRFTIQAKFMPKKPVTTLSGEDRGHHGEALHDHVEAIVEVLQEIQGRREALKAIVDSVRHPDHLVGNVAQLVALAGIETRDLLNLSSTARAT